MKKIVLLLALLILSGCRQKTEVVVSKPEPTLIPTVTIIPTQKPITIDDLNKKYGPCTKVSVLMYHHIQDEATAKVNNQVSLTVTPEFFRKHLQYLKDKGYSVIGMTDLNNFFNKAVALPKKSAIITLDDAYEDNYTNAYPILKEFGYKATIFVPTGHVMGLEYLTWDRMRQMSDLVYFANHTWSHHASTGSAQVLEKEISLADKQLAEHGFNSDKVFAYPYGNPSGEAEKILAKYNYTLAFTTTHGNIMCKSQKYILSRIRIGNAPLSSYGL
ncbi:MAG: polysaccharide deacetylase family protein [Candidatus Shapirobacteria bacterium]|nr:polysaccharide deacetylase family protein [Candidatus Shapirobacteria bacterium]